MLSFDRGTKVAAHFPTLFARLLIEGDDPFEKLPVAIPYMIVPIGAALLLFRFVQATVRVIRGDQDSLIVSHEAEEAIDELAAQRQDS